MKDLQNKLIQFMKNDLPVIVEAEGLKFIKKNFADEGFNDQGLKKWDKRKTKDKKGKDKTFYRTNRVGKAGSLTQFGRRDKGRAILTGHATGGDKLRNSFRTSASPTEVKFITYKAYAKYHNEGNKHLPQRQFIGKSAYLEAQLINKIKRTLDGIFKGG